MKQFWELVQKTETCWLWIGSRHRNGYGLYSFKGKRSVAHRFAWELKYGPIPKGLLACHKCDNPPCCNPDHIFIGTGSDNMRDAFKKGRQANHCKPQDVCKNGHPLVEDNLYKTVSGRQCKTCARTKQTEWRKNNRDKKLKMDRKYWHRVRAPKIAKIRGEK